MLSRKLIFPLAGLAVLLMVPLCLPVTAQTVGLTSTIVPSHGYRVFINNTSSGSTLSLRV